MINGNGFAISLVTSAAYVRSSFQFLQNGKFIARSPAGQHRHFAFVPATMIWFINRPCRRYFKHSRFCPGNNRLCFALLRACRHRVFFRRLFSLFAFHPEFPAYSRYFDLRDFFRFFLENEAKETAPNVNFFSGLQISVFGFNDAVFYHARCRRISLLPPLRIKSNRRSANASASSQHSRIKHSFFICGRRENKNSGCVANGPLPDPLCTPRRRI